MWAFIFSISLSVALTSWSHIVSLDLGADQWVMGLCPKETIHAVTYLAKDSAYSYLHHKAHNIPIHTGQAETLLNPKIQIAVATAPLSPLKKRILEHQKITVIQLATPYTLRDIQEQEHMLRNALNIKSKISVLVPLTPPQTKTPRKKRILIYTGPNGMCPGRNTLMGDILSQLGCAPLPHKKWKTLSKESILNYDPHHIIFTTPPPTQPFWQSLKKRCQFHQVPYRLMLTHYPAALADFIQFIKQVMK